MTVQAAPPPTPLQVDPVGARTRDRRLGRRLTGPLMVAPAVILLLLFFVVPVALCFLLSFTDARLISPTPTGFVGLENFRRLADDPVFWRSLRNTLFFAAIVVPVQSGFGLILALLVNIRMRGTNFFRLLFFVPVVTSIVVVSLVWRFMYHPDGLINNMLGSLTGLEAGVDWLGNPDTAMPAIIFMSIWQAVGFHMVIWLAGLQTIPAELYKAAEIDGAGRWAQFRYITWPGLRATRTFILVTITIAALGLFTQINVMTDGGPLDATSTVVFQAVRVGYRQQDTAYASTISLVFFLLVLAISLAQTWFTRDKDGAS